MKSGDVADHFRHKIASGDPLVGAAVGSGITARHILAGGADFLLSATGGNFRVAGLGSLGSLLPMENANKLIMRSAAREILPRADSKPVVVGLCPTDPACDWDRLIELLLEEGFHGVNNFPSVGFYGGRFRKALEKNGYSFDREVEFLKKSSKAGLFTMAFVFNESESIRMADAGVDSICVNLGVVSGEAEADPEALAKAVDLISRVFKATVTAFPDVIRLFYGGGPIRTPEQMNQVFQESGAQGYLGGSVFERFPTATAVREIAVQYKNIIHLNSENKALRRELMRKKGFDEIVGRSRAMQDLFEVVSKIADKDVNVLITGESGTGKELVVKAIHYNSLRFNQPFIKVSCAAIPDTLLESELFGHTKGAFTGATADRPGLFQLADKGTLFLDEIGEMSLNTQAKLLRAIQQKELQRVGSSRLIKVDLRVVAATNRDLREMVAKGTFREDLYYRLNVISVHTPSLRTHKEDIPLLASYFLRKNAERFGQPICRLTPDALEALQLYDWPGNVRELEHALESATVLCSNSLITRSDLPSTLRGWSDRKAAPTPAADDDEKAQILAALAKNGWRRDQTATDLGISRKTLYNRMERLGIKGGG